ncbi:MAG: UDP-glucose 4-epimerase GalE [Gammaproteobacteria bacterium]
MNSKAVLVTGGAGYIGSHACKALYQRGFLPITVDNLTNGHREAVQWGPLYVANIDDKSTIQAIIEKYKITSVLHFAGSIDISAGEKSPTTLFYNNVIATLALLETIVTHNIKHVVFSSTCAVYGIPNHIPIDEKTICNPINSYGESKLFIEKVLARYQRSYNLQSVALRYFNAAGADADGQIGELHQHETHLIPVAIEAALTNKPFTIFGNDYNTPDGTAIRDYIHVTDLAEAHVAALEYLLLGGNSCHLNLGSGQGHSVREVIHAIERLTQKKLIIKEEARRPGDAPCLIANPQQAQRALAWKTRHSTLTKIIHTALRWHQNPNFLPNDVPEKTS